MSDLVAHCMHHLPECCLAVIVIQSAEGAITYNGGNACDVIVGGCNSSNGVHEKVCTMGKSFCATGFINRFNNKSNVIFLLIFSQTDKNKRKEKQMDVLPLSLFNKKP